MTIELADEIFPGQGLEVQVQVTTGNGVEESVQMTDRRPNYYEDTSS